MNIPYRFQGCSLLGTCWQKIQWHRAEQRFDIELELMIKIDKIIKRYRRHPWKIVYHIDRSREEFLAEHDWPVPELNYVKLVLSAIQMRVLNISPMKKRDFVLELHYWRQKLIKENDYMMSKTELYMKKLDLEILETNLLVAKFENQD